MSSFVELVPIILNQPGVEFFLSEKLCQDPLEKFFGRQRQRGKTNDNKRIVKHYVLLVTSMSNQLLEIAEERNGVPLLLTQMYIYRNTRRQRRVDIFNRHDITVCTKTVSFLMSWICVFFLCLYCSMNQHCHKL